MFRKLSHVLLDAASALGKFVIAGFLDPRPNSLVPIRIRANRARRG
jgi:hypothetical protein